MIDFFNEDSIIAKQQVKLIQEGKLDKDSVPSIYNLREVVEKILATEKEITVTEDDSIDDTVDE